MSQLKDVSKISYEQKNVKDFLSLVQGVFDCHGYGCDSKVYEAFWKLLGSKDFTTVYLTVLLAKINLHEKSSKIEEEAFNEITEVSVEDTLREQRLDSHQPSPNHWLLVQRKEGIRRRKDEETKDTMDEENDLSLPQLFVHNSLLNTLIYVSTSYRFDQNNPALLFVLDQYIASKKNSYLAREVREIICSPLEILSKYIQVCCGYDFISNQDTEMNLTHSFFDPLMLLPSYVYSRLQTICRIPKFTENLISELKYMLSTKKDPKNILNLMNLIIPQLHLNSTITQQLIQSLLPFFLEPFPIGTITKKILKGCKKEIKSPGYLLRERFERSIKQIKTSNGIEDTRRVIHIFYNSYAQFSSYLSKFDILTDLQDEELDNCKANLLLNVFESLEGKESQELLDCSLEVLSKYYKQVSDIMKKAETDGIEKYKSELEDMKSKILKDTTQGTKYCIRQKSPKIPEVAFNLVKLPYEEHLEKVAEKEKKIFPKNIAQTLIQDLVNKLKDETPQGIELTLEIMIAGGSGTVTRVFHAIYVADKSQLFKGIKFKFYILPLGATNYLASYLEKYDGWYSRHLYYPTLSLLPIYPIVKTESDVFLSNTMSSSNYNKKGQRINIGNSTSPKIDYKCPKGFLTPPRHMRTLLSDYCLDATNSLPVHVYGAHLLTNEIQQTTPGAKSGKGKDYIVASFCQRIEVGVHIEDKAKRQIEPNSQKIILSYVSSDFLNTTSSSVNSNEPKLFNSIIIKAVSKYGEKGTLANPSQPFLEVNIQEDNKKKKKFKELDVGTNLHVHSITLESAVSTQASKFHVMIDGEIYGPVHKLIIEKNKSKIVDVMTFDSLEGTEERRGEEEEDKK